MSGAGLAVRALLWREIVRFYRQRNRIVGALLQPLLFWLLLGFGFRGSFQAPAGLGAGDAASYFEYAYPGIVVLTILFTSIFSTISIIEDRREGFLQCVLAAPLPRSAIVLGKVLGGASIALFQGALYLLLAPTVGLHPGIAGVAVALLVLALLSFALTALGFCIAWSMDSTQGFHAIMNVFLIPLWLLSGAFFPPSGGALAAIMRFNPLSYGVGALRRALLGRLDDPSLALPPLLPSLAVSAAFAVLLAVLASRIAARREHGRALKVRR